MSQTKAPATLRTVETRLARASLIGGALAASLGGVALAQTAEASSAAATPAVAAQAGNTVAGVTVNRGRPNLPDTIDPQATYKADRSANAKLTEPLLDTPKTVTVITKDLMDDLGATSFRDLMRTQTGVTLGTGEGGNAYGDRIFVRGFDARGDIYIDGVRDPGVGARETFDIDQIEILKGPSSSIGGRGTTGGAVSLISKQAMDRDFNDLEITGGSPDTRMITYDANRRLNEQWAVRLNVMKTDADVAGRNHVFNNRWGWAAAARYQPTAKLTFSADYYHLSTDEMPDFGIPYDLANNRPFNINRKNFYGVLSRDFRHTFADIYTVKGDWEVSGAVSLHSLARYSQSLNAYTASAPESPNAAFRTVNANPKRRNAISSTWANQTYADLRFATGPVSHTVVAGFEVSGETVTNRGRAFLECATLPCTGNATAVVLNLDNPNNAVARAVQDNGITSLTTADVQSGAIYALDTIKLGEHWEFTGGVRRDSFDLNLKTITVATNAFTVRSNKVDFWNGNAAVVFKPKANGSIYLAYGTSSNPSGEQLDSTALDYGGLDPRTTGLDPEQNRSTEFGTKWNLFGEHLNLTAALFRIEKTNARIAINATTVALAGLERVDGYELGVVGTINPRWSLSGGFTHIDAEIKDSPTASQIGAKFPNVPANSGAFTTKFAFTNWLTLGTTATYASERYGGTVTALATAIPGYWRYDAFGTIRFNRTFALDINVLNLTDKTYYDALYRSATPFVYIAPGRSFSIKADFHF